MLIPVLLVSQIQEHKNSRQTQCSAAICSILSLTLASTGCFKDRSKNFAVSHCKIIYHPLRSHPCFCCWRVAFILKHEVSYPSKHTVIINYSKSDNLTIFTYIHSLYNYCCFLASNNIFCLFMGHWYQNIPENKKKRMVKGILANAYWMLELVHEFCSFMQS